MYAYIYDKYFKFWYKVILKKNYWSIKENILIDRN